MGSGIPQARGQEECMASPLVKSQLMAEESLADRGSVALGPLKGRIMCN
jgi:hypothetical protein